MISCHRSVTNTWFMRTLSSELKVTGSECSVEGPCLSLLFEPHVPVESGGVFFLNSSC